VAGGSAHEAHPAHANLDVVGDLQPGGFDPGAFLTTFDYGRVSRLPDGRTLREYSLVATEREIEVAPGVFFPAWAYNGQVPGPTIRCTEGDRLRVRFARGTHAHGAFHIHPANMDGAFGWWNQVPRTPAGSTLNPSGCSSPLSCAVQASARTVWSVRGGPAGGRAPAKATMV
jgi:hypothetical protein